MDINPVLFPAVTNRESWTQIASLNDDDTGDLIDLTGVTFQLEVRRTRRGWDRSGYGVNYSETGVYSDGGPVLVAAIGSGITLLDTGTFQWYFSESQMRSLSPDTYSVACTIKSQDGIDTRQLFLGRLPVLDGMVTN